MPNYIQIGKDAVEFRDSPRGRFIVAQALYLGIKALYSYPEPMREVSNAMDMKYLLDTLYPGMESVFDSVQPALTPPEEQNIVNVIQYLNKDR